MSEHPRQVAFWMLRNRRYGFGVPIDTRLKANTLIKEDAQIALAFTKMQKILAQTLRSQAQASGEKKQPPSFDWQTDNGWQYRYTGGHELKMFEPDV